MGNLELLDALRSNFVLISLDYRERIKTELVPKEVRKELTGLHTSVVNAFHDNSISFGKRRATPKFMVADLVDAAGKNLVEMKRHLTSLPAEAAREFAIQIRYEPVADAEAFKDLPDRYRAGFTRLLVDGAIRDYEAGMDELVRRLYSATGHYLSSWHRYHEYMTNPTMHDRCLVRDVVVQAVRCKVRVLRAANAADDTNIERFCAMAAFASTDAATLRDDTATRADVIRQARALFDVLAGYLGVDGLEDEGE